MNSDSDQLFIGNVLIFNITPGECHKMNVMTSFLLENNSWSCSHVHLTCNVPLSLGNVIKEHISTPITVTDQGNAKREHEASYLLILISNAVFILKVEYKRL